VIGRLDLICPQKKKENENENRFDFQTTARPSVRPQFVVTILLQLLRGVN
jgi:hypothetical protein